MLEPSLFNIYRQSLSNSNHKVVLSRIMRLSKVKPGCEPTKVAEKHKNIVEGLLANNESETTGLMMIQGEFVLHVLETTSSNMQVYLRNVLSDDSLSFYENDNRILCIIEDFPERMFHEWYSLLLQEKHDHGFNLADHDIASVVDKILCDLEQATIKIDEESHVIHFDAYSNNQPSIELLQGLISSNDFMTDKSFVDFILSPINISEDDVLLPSQAIFPLEGRCEAWLR